jgi:hypothetical protein
MKRSKLGLVVESWNHKSPLEGDKKVIDVALSTKISPNQIDIHE